MNIDIETALEEANREEQGGLAVVGMCICALAGFAMGLLVTLIF